MSDVNMMIRMTESFTLHASEQIKEIAVRKNIFAFVEEVVGDYASNDFQIDISGNRNIEMSIKQMSLKRAFGNVISNAQKYADHLYISISRTDDQVQIMFEDNGYGIDEAKAENLFLPFEKQNEARTHNVDDGVGLGLSIARDAISAHGGSISVKNSETYSGASFVILLPV